MTVSEPSADPDTIQRPVVGVSLKWQWLAPLLLALVFALGFLLSASRSGGLVRAELPLRQVLGTCLMFVLMPTYFLAMGAVQYRRTLLLLEEMRPLAPPAALQAVRERLQRLHPLAYGAVALGLLFGLSQNLYFVRLLPADTTPHPFDVMFVLGNCVLWACVALMIAWRLPVSARLSALGATLPVDLYNLAPVQPLARLATVDVLVTAGAIAFMPLQSLDAQFRLHNYQSGILIGVITGALFLLLPLLGIRRRIRQAKAERLQALQGQIDAARRDDAAGLELLLSHRDRLTSLPNWPLNIRLLTRVLAYGVLAPMAWVAAALVENLVDRF